MKFEFSQQIFEKSLNIKFHQNPSSGSLVVTCGQTDMTMLIVAFRNFANAPENGNTHILVIPAVQVTAVTHIVDIGTVIRLSASSRKLLFVQ
jgi:hypothetical protein